MTLDPKLEKRLIDLMKLMDQAGTPDEAEAATAAFQRTIMRYNIDELEARRLAGQDTNGGFSFGATRYRFAKDQSPGVTWKRHLINTLCHFNFCHFVNLSQKGGLCTIFGEAHNVEMVTTLFERLVPTYERICRDRWTSEYCDMPAQIRRDLIATGLIPSLRKWTGSFLLGVPTGLYARLKEERDAELHDFTGASGLVLVHDGALRTYVEQTIGGTSKITSRSDVDDRAFAAGVKTGREYREHGQVAQRVTKELAG